MHLPDRREIAKALRYDPLTGVFKWKRMVGRSPQWNAAWSGRKAGTRHKQGYIQICVYGRIHKAHRLAWLLMKGYWPEQEIDHRNTNRSDNRWKNLRQASRRQNARNQKKRKNNSSGFKGVSLFKRTGKFQAYIWVNWKKIHLGYFGTPEEAHAAYKAAAKKYHHKFARIK